MGNVEGKGIYRLRKTKNSTLTRKIFPICHIFHKRQHKYLDHSPPATYSLCYRSYNDTSKTPMPIAKYISLLTNTQNEFIPPSLKKDHNQPMKEYTLHTHFKFSPSSIDSVRMIRKSHKNPMCVIFKLVRCFGQGTNGYVQLGHIPIELLPKGHLAVHVGESEDEKQRVLVPVTHFNHPLLGKLLEDAEKVYGFDHPGVITIPCRVSEFERVQKIIATTGGYHRRLKICCSIK